MRARPVLDHHSFYSHLISMLCDKYQLNVDGIIDPQCIGQPENRGVCANESKRAGALCATVWNWYTAVQCNLAVFTA